MTTNATELQECMRMLEKNDREIQKKGFLKCRELADKGNSQAQSLTARLLRSSDINDLGIETDELAAFEYLSKAHAAGNFDATSQLAEMYYQRADYVHAFPLAKMAADATMIEAIPLVGMMYQEGKGVEKDLFQASSYFKSGYKFSDELSSIMYANHLADGYIGPKNPEKAIEILEGVLAKQSYPDQAYKLHTLYQSIKNVEKSDYWLIKAAELGSAPALLQVNRASLNNQLFLEVEGKSINFQLNTGKVIEAIRERRSTVHGYQGNVNTTTNYWYEFKFKTSDDKAFKAIPDNDIPIEIGAKCTLLYVGIKGSGKVSAYRLAPTASSKTYQVMALDRVLGLPKLTPWWVVSVATVILGLYASGFLTLVGVALAAFLIVLGTKNKNILTAVEKRSFEILEKHKLLE